MTKYLYRQDLTGAEDSESSSFATSPLKLTRLSYLVAKNLEYFGPNSERFPLFDNPKSGLKVWKLLSKG